MKPLRALMVEDSEDDAELILRELRRGGYDPAHVRVETSGDMAAALVAGTWDIVFSDFTMPHFNAFDALAELQRSGLDIPFIIISGTIGEDRAVAAMKAGAHDYFLKGNLTRLAAAVERELNEARNRADRRLAGEALRETEARYRMLYERSPNGILLLDVQTGRTVEANTRAHEQLGYTREEFAQMSISDYDAVESAEDTREHTRKVLKEGRDEFETVHRTKSGELRNVRVWTETLQVGGRTLFHAIFEDITERVQAEATMLLQSAALDAAANAIAILDVNGTIEWVNPAFTTLTGYTAGEAIGKNPRDLIRSGAQGAEFYKHLWDTILSGNVWQGELTNRRKDGTLYPEDQTITPVRDARGAIAHFVAIKNDLTEKQQLQAQFLQSQKMESVGHLAGGIAHDFNNLLNVINGTAALALGRLAAGDPLEADLQQIVEAGNRAAALTRQLLAFSRQQIMKPQVIDLRRLFGNMQDMLQRLIGEDVNLVFAAPEGSWSVLADPGQLEQVVMNLAVNARDAMPAGGTLSLRLRALDVDGAFADRHAPLRPGPHVVIEVSDTGTGIDDTTIEHIFEPFFTTKEEGRGTGLGLSTVYGIVQQSGGAIGVRTEPGKGTTFEIHLPRVAEAASATPVPGLAPAAGGDETILVVEDYLPLRLLARRMLESAGYIVLTAGSGEEAVELLERQAGPVHLMLTDVVMPGIGGRELALRIFDAHPTIQVVYTSGYTADALLRQGLSTDAAHFLAKPYSYEALTGTVRAALDAAGRSRPV